MGWDRKRRRGEVRSFDDRSLCSRGFKLQLVTNFRGNFKERDSFEEFNLSENESYLSLKIRIYNISFLVNGETKEGKF